VTLPYALQIANKGVIRAVQENKALLQGVNVAAGSVSYKAVADSLGHEYVPVEQALEKLPFAL
jgi:alanine dehydrogenase